MAASGFDATTGHPEFDDSDAPDIKVDPQLAAEYAAYVGNRISDTAANRGTYAYDREGLEWYETDTGDTYIHRSGNWVLWDRPLTAFTPTLTGLTLGTGGVASGQYSVHGGVVTLFINIVLGTGATASSTIYLSFPITANTTYKQIGTFLAIGPSGARSQGIAGQDTSARFWLLNTANNFLSNSQPWTWASTHEIRVQGSYVPA